MTKLLQKFGALALASAAVAAAPAAPRPAPAAAVEAGGERLLASVPQGGSKVCQCITRVTRTRAWEAEPGSDLVPTPTFPGCHRDHHAIDASL
jgi:hypothetical protein